MWLRLSDYLAPSFKGENGSSGTLLKRKGEIILNLMGEYLRISGEYRDCLEGGSVLLSNSQAGPRTCLLAHLCSVQCMREEVVGGNGKDMGDAKGNER